MNLRNKILLFTMVLVLILGLSIALFVNISLKDTLTSELRERGILDTKQLAHMSIDDIVTDQKLRLRLTINAQRASNKQMQYIFIKDAKNNVFVHTFGKTFPGKLKDINNPKNLRSYSIMNLDTTEGDIIDIAVPISK